MNTEQTALLMEAEDGASLWHDAWLRLKKNRAAVTGGAVSYTHLRAHET